MKIAEKESDVSPVCEIPYEPEDHVNITAEGAEYTLPGGGCEGDDSEGVFFGVVGAFLFSLAGAFLYFLIYRFGYIAGVSGLVTFALAYLGYGIFSGKKNSLKGVAAAVAMSVIAIAAAEYLGLGYDIYKVYKDEVSITFFDALAAVPDFLKESDVLAAFIKDLAVSYVLCAFAAFIPVRNAVRAAKSNSSLN